MKNKRFHHSRVEQQSSLAPELPAEYYMDPQYEFLALDCEMVGIGPNGTTSSAASVTVIDWNGTTMYHSFIRQTVPVTDYRTFVSGITKEQLEDDSQCASIEECRAIVVSLLYNRILVGHGVYNDLEVLGFSHPWWLTRDTASYEPFMWCRSIPSRKNENKDKLPLLFPRKLKHLAKEKLNRDIQMEGRPHSAYEDALAALDLYRMVCRKWEGVISLQLQKQQKLEAAAAAVAQRTYFYHTNTTIHPTTTYHLQLRMDYNHQALAQEIYFNNQKQKQQL